MLYNCHGKENKLHHRGHFRTTTYNLNMLMLTVAAINHNFCYTQKLNSYCVDKVCVGGCGLVICLEFNSVESFENLYSDCLFLRQFITSKTYRTVGIFVGGIKQWTELMKVCSLCPVVVGWLIQ